MLRGIDRQTIFQEEEDCEKYLQCLSDCQKLSGFTLYAHYLMGNHIHLPLPCEAREADCNAQQICGTAVGENTPGIAKCVGKPQKCAACHGGV